MTAGDDTPDVELSLEEKLERHALRIAVLGDRADRAAAKVSAARTEGVPDFKAARDKGIKQVVPKLPDGTEIGLISIQSGGVDVQVDEDLLILAVRPDDLEPYVLEAALTDERVLKLLADFLPEMVERRINPKLRAELQTELVEHGGYVANRVTGEKEQVATITPLPASGRFSYKAGKLSQQQITAAIDAGLVTADGEIPEPSTPERTTQESLPI